MLNHEGNRKAEKLYVTEILHVHEKKYYFMVFRQSPVITSMYKLIFIIFRTFQTIFDIAILKYLCITDL